MIRAEHYRRAEQLAQNAPHSTLFGYARRLDDEARLCGLEPLAANLREIAAGLRRIGEDRADVAPVGDGDPAYDRAAAWRRLVGHIVDVQTEGVTDAWLQRRLLAKVANGTRAQKLADDERAEADSYREVVGKVAAAAGCPGAPTRWNVADLVERVENLANGVAPDLVEVRKVVEHHGATWRADDPALAVDNAADLIKQRSEAGRDRIAAALGVDVHDPRQVWPRTTDQLVAWAADLVTQRDRLHDFESAVRGLLDDDVPPFLSRDEVVAHLREQLGRTEGDDSGDLDGPAYLAGLEAGRKPEIVTGGDVNALPVGSRFVLVDDADVPRVGKKIREVDGDPRRVYGTDRRYVVLYRAPARPLAVGDEVTVQADLECLPVGTVLATSWGRGRVAVRVDDSGNALSETWKVCGTNGLLCAPDHVTLLPARVLDLPAATS